MEETKKNLDVILKYFADFTPTQIAQLEQLAALYEEWNAKINVISRKDMESLYLKHVLHSLSIAAAFELSDGSEVVDLGTGGGFPGIPLAIFFPNIQFHCVDSIGKKITVVKAVAEGIGLQNLTAAHTRIEEIKNRKFDYVVSRAVAPLGELWKWSKPLLRKQKEGLSYKPGLICLKGGDLTTEIAESMVKPSVMEIQQIFEEDFFAEKYIVYVPQQ
ncbi:16S rRNA (guanine(527)-N(7))-methyltransferase RsmG [Gynurincola endophyticus]|jgi:16S rRNA (guanine527-N7)-methyltransferase|uniref:16S rRNA (guanine(527)-N(7))-methyltransferase RsmG n=1 Tax=Gynurincola endophyticus TaxID=2479004 RepID=UPI001F3205B0|nr:16S rRNA (guanine(527)-N(7))-methyltransferase RsmG [Gynurincola endophyticus]